MLPGFPSSWALIPAVLLSLPEDDHVLVTVWEGQKLQSGCGGEGKLLIRRPSLQIVCEECSGKLRLVLSHRASKWLSSSSGVGGQVYKRWINCLMWHPAPSVHLLHQFTTGFPLVLLWAFTRLFTSADLPPPSVAGLCATGHWMVSGISVPSFAGLFHILQVRTAATGQNRLLLLSVKKQSHISRIS